MNEILIDILTASCIVLTEIATVCVIYLIISCIRSN